MADADALTLQIPGDPLAAAQAARESAARRLAGNVQARPREVPYPWGSMGDWLADALRPERIEQMFMGLGTDAPRGGKITAYHGSPHDFDVFDISKIGTGEGAQMYGHGLYFAENPEVAGGYRKGMKQSPPTPPQEVKDAMRRLDYLGFDRPGEALKEMRTPGWRERWDVGDPQSSRDADIIDKWIAENPWGRNYKVAINADPEHFLDWHTPLNQQSQPVQDAIRQLWQQNKLSGDPGGLTGQGIHHSIQAHYYQAGMPKGGGREAAAMDLRSAGIPGIRYFDQGSRTASEGTRNFVVFDDKLIDVLKKYGWAGIAALGYGALPDADRQ